MNQLNSEVEVDALTEAIAETELDLAVDVDADVDIETEAEYGDANIAVSFGQDNSNGGCGDCASSSSSSCAQLSAEVSAADLANRVPCDTAAQEIVAELAAVKLQIIADEDAVLTVADTIIVSDAGTALSGTVTDLQVLNFMIANLGRFISIANDLSTVTRGTVRVPVGNNCGLVVAAMDADLQAFLDRADAISALKVSIDRIGSKLQAGLSASCAAGDEFEGFAGCL